MAHQYNEKIPALAVPGSFGQAIEPGTPVTVQHINGAKADETRFANTPHAVAAATRRIVVEQATVRAINPEAGAAAWFAPAMAAALEPILQAIQVQQGQLGAMQLQLGAMQTNAVIRNRINRNQSDLQALVKEAPLLAGQEPGPNLGALGAVPPPGMFPASVDEIDGLTHDQVTAIATWYGIAGTMMPHEGDAGIMARRSALIAWIGV